MRSPSLATVPGRRSGRMVSLLAGRPEAMTGRGFPSIRGLGTPVPRSGRSVAKEHHGFWFTVSTRRTAPAVPILVFHANSPPLLTGVVRQRPLL